MQYNNENDPQLPNTKQNKVNATTKPSAVITQTKSFQQTQLPQRQQPPKPTWGGPKSEIETRYLSNFYEVASALEKMIFGADIISLTNYFNRGVLLASLPGLSYQDFGVGDLERVLKCDFDTRFRCKPTIASPTLDEDLTLVTWCSEYTDPLMLVEYQPNAMKWALPSTDKATPFGVIHTRLERNMINTNDTLVTLKRAWDVQGPILLKETTVTLRHSHLKVARGRPPQFLSLPGEGELKWVPLSLTSKETCCMHEQHKIVISKALNRRLNFL